MKSNSKRNSRGEMRDILFYFSEGGRKSIILEGSHATPARLSGRNNVKMKMLY
jgi:hypothetical protein